jgi:hypothetical protein
VSTERWTMLAALGIALLVAFGCTVPIPSPPGEPLCDSETEAYLSEIDPVLTEWQDTVELAQATARIGLSPVVQDLQSLRRRAAEATAPTCAQDASGLLVIGMDEVIAGFIDFMGESADVIVKARLAAGALEITTAKQQLDALATGIPAPIDSDHEGRAQSTTQAVEEARQLSHEIDTAFSQAALSEDYFDFCHRVGDWATRAQALKAWHAESATPHNPHLQAARIWLGMGFTDCAQSTDAFVSWCQAPSQTLTAMDCWERSSCLSAVEQQGRFAFTIVRAEAEIDAYGGPH